MVERVVVPSSRARRLYLAFERRDVAAVHAAVHEILNRVLEIVNPGRHLVHWRVSVEESQEHLTSQMWSPVTTHFGLCTTSANAPEFTPVEFTSSVRSSRQSASRAGSTASPPVTYQSSRADSARPCEHTKPHSSPGLTTSFPPGTPDVAAPPAPAFREATGEVAGFDGPAWLAPNLAVANRFVFDDGVSAAVL